MTMQQSMNWLGLLTRTSIWKPKSCMKKQDRGRTIIEKLEDVQKRPGYAFVLLTPDDLGAEQVSDEKIEYFNNQAMKLTEQKTQFKYRARQNVIFELGFFIGLLSRSRVCCLYKKGVEQQMQYVIVVGNQMPILSSNYDLSYSILTRVNSVVYSIVVLYV